MMFVLRMARRETRASWKRLLFFFLCLAIGVGAIVALRSVIQSVRGVIAGEARTLTGGDLLLTARRAWTAEDRARLDRHLTTARGVEATTHAIETATMVRPADDTRAVARMVELRGVGPEFPLYGELTLAGRRPYDPALLEDAGALVRPELLAQLGIGVGDAILIAERPFTIRGVIDGEPGRRLGGFSLGPRVLVSLEALEETELLSFGSRARFQIMARVAPAQLDGLARALRSDFRSEYVSVRTWKRTESNIGEDLQRAEDYLSLVGLVIVVLGGIGVSSVTRVFVEQKLKSIAVLKCVGASTRQVLAIYVLQVLLLGLAGSLLGLVLAAVAMAALPSLVGAIAPGGLTIEYGLTQSAVVQGLAVGLLVCLLFSLVPLLRVRRIRPSLLLRQESGPPGRDWLRAATAVLVGIALVGVVAWQAGSLRVGLVVCAGFIAVVIVLWGAGWVLVKATRPLTQVRWFPLRHAALHLDRPGNQTRVVLLAVGLGCFFIVGVRAIQANLLTQFSLDLAPDAPDMFLVDIQQDQVPALEPFLTRHSADGKPPRLLPVLRARVTAVRGREVEIEGVQAVRQRGSLAREYTVTYRPRLARNERVIAGTFWDETPSATPEVSIEESIRERFDIFVGDTIQFLILGEPIEARVTSVREVEWRDLRSGGFMFVFRPGVLDDAPHQFIAVLAGPTVPARRARMQRDLTVQFPNVSVIDLREVLETARGVIRSITLGVTVVGGLVLFTGALILTGAVAMTKFRRTYEAAVLKTLGASRRVVGSLLLIEYGLLGLLSGVVGAGGGLILSWAISRFAIEMDWVVPWREALTGVVAATLLVAAVGVLASLDVLRRKPLATLRAE